MATRYFLGIVLVILALVGFFRYSSIDATVRQPLDTSATSAKNEQYRADRSHQISRPAAEVAYDSRNSGRQSKKVATAETAISLRPQPTPAKTDEPKITDGKSDGDRIADESDSSPSEDNIPLLERFESILIANNWPGEAARALVTLNASWIESRDEKIVSELARVILLGQVLSNREFGFLAKSPELVPWVAMSSSPKRFCDNVRRYYDPDHRKVLTNILLLQQDFHRSDDIAECWGRFGDRITRSWRFGYPGIESLLMPAALADEDEQYFAWVDQDLFPNEIFAPSPNSDSPLLSRVLIGIVQGPIIRHRLASTLESDQVFRESFHELWESLVRVSHGSSHKLERLACHPHIWDFLQRQDGESLADELGVAAVDILSGEDAFPLDLQPRVLSLLKSNQKVVVLILLNKRFRTDVSFRKLLADKISDDLLIRICDDLFEHPLESNEILAQVSKESLQELSQRYRKPIDIKSWDDDWPALLKIPKRKLTGQALDDGDVQKVGIEIVRLGLEVAEKYVPPAAIVTVPLDAALDHISSEMSVSLDKTVEEYAKKSERLNQVMSRNEVKRLILLSQNVHFVGEILQLAKELAANSREDAHSLYMPMLEFMYRKSDDWQRNITELQLAKKIVMIDSEDRLWILPFAESKNELPKVDQDWLKTASFQWLTTVSKQGGHK